MIKARRDQCKLIHKITFFLSNIFLLQSIEGSSSYSIEPRTWRYKKYSIGYEEAQPTSSIEKAEPVLLLNGFGVGSFHQHRLVSKFFDVSLERKVYCVDYLGQGRSWPEDCRDGNADSERGLIYSIDTWVDQVIDFIEEVILPNHVQKDDHDAISEDKEIKVHLVGNSVGGHLAAFLAARRPDLIRTVILLNATPVWGLNLPFWSGHLPPPPIPRIIGRVLFDLIRDERTIRRFLENTYASPDAFDDTLVQQIRACTEGPGGHAAFASILWSPPATLDDINLDFSTLLTRVQCDVLLVFGKDDPWCKPIFAKKMIDALTQRNPADNYDDSPTKTPPVHRFIELSNVGHCPNHEAPQAVALILKRWLEAEERRDVRLVDDENAVVVEPWGNISIQEANEEEDTKLGFFDQLVTKIVG